MKGEKYVTRSPCVVHRNTGYLTKMGRLVSQAKRMQYSWILNLQEPDEDEVADSSMVWD